MAEVQVPSAFKELFQPSRYKAYWGGRGSAKSHSIAQALILKAAQKPLRILCAREIQRSIKDSVKRLLDDKIARAGLSSFFETTETEIRGRNGSLFVFAGLRTNMASIKSLEGIDVCWIEEASTVSRSSIDTLIPTIRKPGSELIFSWNPDQPTDPVDVMFRGPEGPPPDSIVRRVNAEDNPFFPDVLRKELEYDQKRDPEKYAHVWLGEYQRNSEARVFRNWSVEEFEAPVDAVHRFGADWGFAIDPTVLVRCHLIGRKLYVDYEAYMVGCEIDNTPSLFDSVPESRRYLITADSARPETVSYMQRNGFPKIVPAIKGPGSVEDGVEFLKNYDIVVHPRCQHVIDELTLYSYKIDKLTDAVLPQLDDKSNHTIDALRYACEGARRAGKATTEPAPLPVETTGEFGWMS
jgi:phage terminase large subunit